MVIIINIIIICMQSVGYQKVLRRYNQKKDSVSFKQQQGWLKRWDRAGCAKVALKISSQKEATDIEEVAAKLGLPTCHVRDAGRTQIAAGSMTVVAVGPGPAVLIDQITGHLKLM